MTDGVRRGRRPGRPDTRAEILTAARQAFAEHGFAATTIRAIATAAGVDTALVHHYFGNKDDLFVAALALPEDPRETVLAAVEGPMDQAGERVVRAFLTMWEDPGLQPAFMAMSRRLVEPDGDSSIRDSFVPVLLDPLGERLGVDRPDLRMPLVASQVLGIVFARYVIGIEPIASMDTETLVEIYSPTVQRYLTGELP